MDQKFGPSSTLHEPPNTPIAVQYSSLLLTGIFGQVGVNPDLYYNVFGESLLNDGVAVVLYNMMIAFAGKIIPTLLFNCPFNT